MLELEIDIDFLANRREFIPLLCQWLADEWPDWYGPDGPGDAQKVLDASADRERIPIGIVAISENRVVGYVSLKAEAVSGWEEYGPWVGAALVDAKYRNRGIGTLLIDCLESEAKRLGCKEVYSGNRKPAGFLLRKSWSLIDRVSHNSEELYVYSKSL